jgi:hypothetical protein
MWTVKTVRIYANFPYVSGNRTDRVMSNVLASSAVDRGFEARSGKTKDYKIGICR